jgi:cupin 2 domain-containing protein
VNNFFVDIPENLKDELFQTILQTPCFRVERIVSHGHYSPDGFWYDQDENEWVILLKGSAGLRFEDQDGILVLNPGDYIHINEHQKHRVEWTDTRQETIWLAVYYKNY